jgi:predicted RNase H-like HicB family nuclease
LDRKHPIEIRKKGQKEEQQQMLFYVNLEQAEDGWLVAEVPALPGCVSQGKTEEEAIENIKEAITAWVWAENQKTHSTTTSDNKYKEIVVVV